MEEISKIISKNLDEKIIPILNKHNDEIKYLEGLDDGLKLIINQSIEESKAAKRQAKIANWVSIGSFLVAIISLIITIVLGII